MNKQKRRSLIESTSCTERSVNCPRRLTPWVKDVHHFQNVCICHMTSTSIFPPKLCLNAILQEFQTFIRLCKAPTAQTTHEEAAALSALQVTKSILHLTTYWQDKWMWRVETGHVPPATLTALKVKHQREVCFQPSQLGSFPHVQLLPNEPQLGKLASWLDEPLRWSFYLDRSDRCSIFRVQVFKAPHPCRTHQRNGLPWTPEWVISSCYPENPAENSSHANLGCQPPPKLPSDQHSEGGQSESHADHVPNWGW